MLKNGEILKCFTIVAYGRQNSTVLPIRCIREMYHRHFPSSFCTWSWRSWTTYLKHASMVNIFYLVSWKFAESAFLNIPLYTTWVSIKNVLKLYFLSFIQFFSFFHVANGLFSTCTELTTYILNIFNVKLLILCPSKWEYFVDGCIRMIFHDNIPSDM